jgi:hypothetical protein
MYRGSRCRSATSLRYRGSLCRNAAPLRYRCSLCRSAAAPRYRGSLRRSAAPPRQHGSSPRQHGHLAPTWLVFTLIKHLPRTLTQGVPSPAGNFHFPEEAHSHALMRHGYRPSHSPTVKQDVNRTAPCPTRRMHPLFLPHTASQGQASQLHNCTSNFNAMRLFHQPAWPAGQRLAVQSRAGRLGPRLPGGLLGSSSGW